jgi:hypothetical protein
VSDAEPAADAEPRPPDAPVALDGLVYGIDLLDALLVLHLGDAHLYASWVRAESGLRPDDVVTTLRDVYRVAQFTAKRLNGGADRRGEAPAPLLTLELPQRVALLRRIRSYVVATVFDAAMPLGMARMISARLAAALEPELPLGPAPVEPQKPRVAVPAPADPVVRAAKHDTDAPHTLSFGAGLPRRSHPPPARAPEADRVSRLLAYLESHAPEPHVVKYRLALRAGLTLSALEHPEGLGPEAMILVETAVQDILGIDRAELRRIA